MSETDLNDPDPWKRAEAQEKLIAQMDRTMQSQESIMQGQDRIIRLLSYWNDELQRDFLIMSKHAIGETAPRLNLFPPRAGAG